jgi:hypothetical protein
MGGDLLFKGRPAFPTRNFFGPGQCEALPQHIVLHCRRMFFLRRREEAIEDFYKESLTY